MKNKSISILFLFIINLSVYGQINNVDVGSSADDGTGDNLRNAFIKVNNNDNYLDAIKLDSNEIKTKINDSLTAARSQLRSDINDTADVLRTELAPPDSTWLYGTFTDSAGISRIVGLDSIKDGVTGNWYEISDFLVSGIDSLFDDKSPELGGDLDVNGNNINISSNDTILFGELAITRNSNGDWIRIGEHSAGDSNKIDIFKNAFITDKQIDIRSNLVRLLSDNTNFGVHIIPNTDEIGEKYIFKENKIAYWDGSPNDTFVFYSDLDTLNTDAIILSSNDTFTDLFIGTDTLYFKVNGKTFKAVDSADYSSGGSGETINSTDSLSTLIKLNGFHNVVNDTLTTDVTLEPDTSNSIVGGKTLIHLNSGTGGHEVSFLNFHKIYGSYNIDTIANRVNIINAFYDGIYYWYYINLEDTIGFNAYDEISPVIELASIESGSPNQITLFYDELLDELSVPDPTDYTSSGTVTGSNAITNVVITDSNIILTLTTNYVSDDVITIDFTSTSSPVVDIAGNEASNLVDYSVTNNISGLSALMIFDASIDTTVTRDVDSLISNWESITGGYDLQQNSATAKPVYSAFYDKVISDLSNDVLVLSPTLDIGTEFTIEVITNHRSNSYNILRDNINTHSLGLNGLRSSPYFEYVDFHGITQNISINMDSARYIYGERVVHFTSDGDSIWGYVDGNLKFGVDISPAGEETINGILTSIVMTSKETKYIRIDTNLIIADSVLSRYNTLSEKITENTPPYATSVVIDDLTPNVSETINVSYTYNDDESDTENSGIVLYFWEVSTDSGSTWAPAFGTNTNSSYSIPGSYSGNQLRCRVWVFANTGNLSTGYSFTSNISTVN